VRNITGNAIARIMLAVYHKISLVERVVLNALATRLAT
jgi:hypothetical protein